MNPLIIVKITTEPDPRFEYRTRWVVAFSYPSNEDDPFIVWKTGNVEEAQDLPLSQAGSMGYSADEVEVRHLY